MKMRVFSGLFFVVCLFCAAIAFPTSELDDDAEIVVVPLEARQDRGDGQTVVDADGTKDPTFFSFEPYNPFRWNFSIFDDFQNIMRQLSDRVRNVWSELPVDSETGSEKSDPTVKSNSTSRVEYIDGQKVVINDTIYTKETDFGASVYKVRVIEFLPTDDDITSIANKGQSESDVESVNAGKKNKSNSGAALDKGSPEELDNNDNENEVNGDIDDVEVIPSPDSPVV